MSERHFDQKTSNPIIKETDKCKLLQDPNGRALSFVYRSSQSFSDLSYSKAKNLTADISGPDLYQTLAACYF